jgi:hypothetical protein
MADADPFRRSPRVCAPFTKKGFRITALECERSNASDTGAHGLAVRFRRQASIPKINRHLEATTMEKSEIRALATKAFSDKYPEDTEVTSTDVVTEAFGGALAVVRSKEKNGNPNEEIVYVYPDKTVRVFGATEDMAAFLEQKARKLNVIDIMSNNSFIAGCVFLFLIVAVFIAGPFNSEVQRADFRR